MVHGAPLGPPGEPPSSDLGRRARRKQAPDGDTGESAGTVEAARQEVTVSLSLEQHDLDRLQAVADRANIDVGEVIQRSIATSLFLQQQIDKGSTILIRRRDGTTYEMVLNY
jgi:hypothetical protein